MENDRIDKWIVSNEEKGDRIDRFLSLLLFDKTRSGIQEEIIKGNVSVNGKVCKKKNYIISSGDEILFLHTPPEPISVEPEDIPIDIIYEDDQLLVVNKPKGLIVHPGAGNARGTLVNGLLFHCKDRLSSINGKVRPGIVHRIDKDTTGLLVVAKTDKAHRHLAAQLEAHTVQRKYRALVYNQFKETEGTVDKNIGRDPNMRLRMAVVPRGGKSAITHYKVLESLGRFSLIELSLETGRTHQIRVHMASLGHGLLGDETYGPKKKLWNIKGQMLQAYYLGFVHPVTKKNMAFQVDMDPEFLRVYKILQRQGGQK